MLGIPDNWSGGIEDLVQEANRHLAVLLPADRSARPKDEVNARLVRHYTTQGLLQAPGKEGREARYTRLHLLNLLALRRLMADGLSGKALYAALSGRSEEEFARLAVQGSGPFGEQPRVEDDGSPLAYLRRLKQREAGPSAGLERPLLARAASSMAPERMARRVKGPRVEHVTRVQVAPGLVLEVGEGFRANPGEREQLLDTIWEMLTEGAGR